MPAANRLRLAMMLYREPACAHVRWLTAGGIFCREAGGEQSELMARRPGLLRGYEHASKLTSNL